MMNLKPASKRLIKSVRNLVRDPLPRTKTIELSEVEVSGSDIVFNYSVNDRKYVNRVTLPASLEEPLRAAAGPALDQLLITMGLAFAAFLFKLSDFAEVAVKTGPLDASSRSFFEDFFRGGLGEFRYLQGLNPARRIKVTASDGPAVAPMRFDTEDRLLMLNGGGKDTIVAAELLKAAGQPFTWVTVRPNSTRRRVIELSNVPESIEVGYEVDEQIERDKAYPWGHIPHTSIVLSVGLLVAILTKARYVAVGNELSANFGNLIYRGHEVNHQYTKSFAFERGFWGFAKSRVTESVDVFSILRPFHDLQLAELFVGQKKYLGHFISCNRGISRGEWCKDCPKCAFTALALRAFVGAEELCQVFGEDVFKRRAIREHILDLVTGSIKPWECVGNRQECELALGLVLDGNPTMDFDSYPRRSDLLRALGGVDVNRLRSLILEHASDEHLIPSALVAKLNAGLPRVPGRRSSFPRSSLLEA